MQANASLSHHIDAVTPNWFGTHIGKWYVYECGDSNRVHGSHAHFSRFNSHFATSSLEGAMRVGGHGVGGVVIDTGAALVDIIIAFTIIAEFKPQI